MDDGIYSRITHPCVDDAAQVRYAEIEKILEERSDDIERQEEYDSHDCNEDRAVRNGNSDLRDG